MNKRQKKKELKKMKMLNKALFGLFEEYFPRGGKFSISRNRLNRIRQKAKY